MPIFPTLLTQASADISTLVATSKNGEQRYLSSCYREAEVRNDPIDKLFLTLGWDVKHNVQTDSGSAVDFFLDEVLRIPDVVLIGTAPLSDRRSDSLTFFDLPRGSASLNNPAMIRTDRSRDEIEEYEPKFRFDGNITDTNAVKQWV